MKSMTTAESTSLKSGSACLKLQSKAEVLAYLEGLV